MAEMEHPVFTLYTGCLIDRRFPGFEAATRFVAEKLGWQLKEAQGFTCCPDPVWVRSSNVDTWLTLAARNLAIASQNDAPLLTLCNGCFETLNSAAKILAQSPEKAQRVEARLQASGLSYPKPIQVRHFLQVLVDLYHEEPDRLTRHIVRPLQGLRLAPHPGCHLTRPSEYAQFDDPLNPRAMDEILQALGAEVVDYPERTHCCGLPIFATDRDLSLSMARDKVAVLQDQADALVVTCPSCFLQFETAQALDREHPHKLPVFFLSELMALAMGADPKALALNAAHRVPVAPVLEKLEVYSHAQS